MEQRAVIKFNAKLGKSASETFRSMQQVYGSQCLGRTAVFEWHKRFLEGRETLEEDKKSGRPILVRTPEMIEKVRDFVANDRNASLKMMEEALNISRETISRIEKSFNSMSVVLCHQIDNRHELDWKNVIILDYEQSYRYFNCSTFLELLEEKTEKTAMKLLALMSQDLADEPLMKFTSV
ncbi:SETMR methyltransferase, partial [Acromyrmex charruanus]